MEFAQLSEKNYYYATMLPVCTQRLTELEIVVWDIFDFFEPICT